MQLSVYFSFKIPWNYNWSLQVDWEITISLNSVENKVIKRRKIFKIWAEIFKVAAQRKQIHIK